MIEGLKLTLTGEELRSRLEDQVNLHEREARRWKREAARTAADATQDEPLPPEHICENEAERHEWRVEVLEFIREHLEPHEIYRLGEADLVFAELLPERPAWMDAEDIERRDRRSSPHY